MTFKDTDFYQYGQVFDSLKSDNILFSFSPKPSQTVLGRLLNALNHPDTVTPFHRIGLCLLVIRRNLETAGFQTFHVHHKSTIFGMEKLHQLTAATDKYEHIPILHATPHTFMHHTAQGTDTFTHIGSART